MKEDETREGQLIVHQPIFQTTPHHVLDPRKLLGLQRRVEALDLELVQLFVVEQPVLVLVAHQEDPLERPHAQGLE